MVYSVWSMVLVYAGILFGCRAGRKLSDDPNLLLLVGSSINQTQDLISFLLRSNDYSH